jgi:hypothetical protein
MPRLRYAGGGSRDSLEKGPPAIGGIAGAVGDDAGQIGREQTCH